MYKQITILIIFLITTTNIFTQKTPDLALTPPMGWNSWNTFGCDNINEKVVRDAADAMVSTGMKQAGYEYIIIDDCWQVARQTDGTIVVDSVRFPSGMKVLADYVHSKGLKFGLYSCAGKQTCAGRPGGNGYEIIDAKTYASWGVDYLKYDWCNTNGIDAKKAYTDMSRALRSSGRPIVFNMCEWGVSRPFKWAKNVAHLWRTTVDIQDCWDCKKDWGGMGWTTILDMQVGLEKYAGPGHWNDPDMLEVGNGHMKYNEYIAHFSFWCLLSAPLIAGNDLKKMNDSIKNILLNKYAIEVNQDKLGIQGSKILDDGDFEIWSKKMSNNRTAIILFNRNGHDQTVEIEWSKLGFKQKNNLFDIWKREDIGTVNANKTINIPGHSVKFFIVNK